MSRETSFRVEKGGREEKKKKREQMKREEKGRGKGEK
jgi:hypothetical protein